MQHPDALPPLEARHDVADRVHEHVAHVQRPGRVWQLLQHVRLPLGRLVRHLERMLALFPDSARIEHGRLGIGGAIASELAEEFGTPLVVYCEGTLRARARAYL